MTHITSTIFPDPTNRAHRIAALSQALRQLLNMGVSGKNLIQQLRTSSPAEITCDADGFSVTCYGLTAPPAPTKERAVTIWATLAEELVPMPGGAPC